MASLNGRGNASWRYSGSRSLELLQLPAVRFFVESPHFPIRFSPIPIPSESTCPAIRKYMQRDDDQDDRCCHSCSGDYKCCPLSAKSGKRGVSGAA